MLLFKIYCLMFTITYIPRICVHWILQLPHPVCHYYTYTYTDSILSLSLSLLQNDRLHPLLRNVYGERVINPQLNERVDS